MLVGRSEAFDRITWVVSGARAGRGSALLLRGDPGCGKTALLAAAAAAADGLTLLRCTGTEDEKDLPFAALHALVRPLRHLVGELVPAQREALGVALGDAVGARPSSLQVGSATLSLLDLAAVTGPVLVLVDDLHWVDVESREAIGFAARRLEDDAVGVLLAARPEAVRLNGIDCYDIPLLDDEEAIALLAGHGVVRTVADRLCEPAGGNPLALVEIATSLDPAQRRGTEPLPEPLPSTSPAAVYGVLLAALPPRARTAAATAALAGGVAPPVLADALARVGAGYDDLVRVEETGLLRTSLVGVVWRHPLARAAATSGTSPAELRRIHLAVAESVAAAAGDPATVVWHRVRAGTGPDEGLATALDAVAEAAKARGAHLAAARAWEAGAQLGRDRSRRLALAALEAWAGDDAESATRLLEESLPTLEDADLRWSLAYLAGEVSHVSASPQAAYDWFQRAVGEARVAGRTDREVKALASSFNPALHLDDSERLSVLAEQILAVAAPDDPLQQARSHAVQGFVLLNAEQTDAGRAHLEVALALIGEHGLLEVDVDLLPMTVQAAMWSGHPQRLRPQIDAALAGLRAAGDTRQLLTTVRGLAWCDFSVAEWDSAAVRAEEGLDLARISGRSADVADALVQVATLEGARGHAADALAHAEEARRLATAMGSPWRTADALWCAVFATMSAGDLEALTAPAQALADVVREGRVAATQPEFLDAPLALALGGRRAEAQDLLDLLVARVGDDARPESRAGAVLARCAIGPDSLHLAGEAAALAEELDGVEYVFPRARVRLSGGSMMRRLGHRVEARVQLRGAETDFAALGAAPWLARVQEELRASGATLRSRAAPDDALTASETRVATAAANGMSNKEIAAALFLSGKTVEFHLGRVYRKLGVRSRSELVRLMLAPAPDPGTASER